MNPEKENNNLDNFELNQDRIIADAAKNIVDEQSQLFPEPEQPNYPSELVENNISSSPQAEVDPTGNLGSVTNPANNYSQPITQGTEPITTTSASFDQEKSLANKLPKGKKTILVVFATLLLIAGILVGVTISANALFNKPESVVAKSILNTTKANYFNAIKTNISVNSGEGASMSFYALGGQKGAVTRADFNLKYSLFNIDGSAIYDNQSETSYFKINGLSDIAKAMGAPSVNDQKINSWFKISEKNLGNTTKELGIKDTNANSQVNPMKCVQSMSQYMQTEEFKNKLTEAYNKNQFAAVSKLGKDMVDNQKTTKYQVAVNGNAFDLFMTDLTDNTIQPKLAATDANCKIDSTEKTKDSSQVQVKNVFVWVNSKKQLLQIAGEVSSGSTSTTIQLNLINDQKLDYSLPTNTVENIKEIFNQ